MDLLVGERVLKTLEDEANRLRGIGDLREQIDTVLTDFSTRLSELSSASQLLESLAKEGDASRQEIGSLQHKAVRDLESNLSDFQGLVKRQLQEDSDVIRAGLAEVHRQVLDLALQVDRGVKAELARSSGEFRADLNTAFGTLSREFDVSTREQRQALETALASVQGDLNKAARTVIREIRVAVLCGCGFLVSGAAILWWVLNRS
jgi:hypothetical protein